MRNLVLPIAVSCVLCLTAPDVRSQSLTLPNPTNLPAVSGLNGTLSFDGAHIPNGGILGGTASISVPLSHSFGLQIDGSIAGKEGIDAGGGAAHLFWRDPGVGLLGLYGGYLSSNGAFGGGSSQVWNPAFEAELYLGRVTIGGSIGADILQAGGSTATSFASTAHLDYYLTDDLVVRLGHRYSFESNLGLLEIETQLAQLPVGGLSVYGTGLLFENGDLGAMGGVKIYFGESGKTLIRRNREDDPMPWWMRWFFEEYGFIPRCPANGGEYNFITRRCPDGSRPPNRPL